MKKTAKDVLFGILIIIVITFLEFIVTIPFDLPGEVSRDVYIDFMNREFLLTALPAGLVTFLFTWLLKTKKQNDAVRRSIVWTVVIFLNYFLIGIGNSNLGELFSTYGIYLLLLCSFAGPIIYAKLKIKNI